MSTTGKTVFAGLVLLFLIFSGYWLLFSRSGGDSYATVDKLVADLCWEGPWHCRLLKRTDTLRFFPKSWFPNAYYSDLDISLRIAAALTGLIRLGTNAWPAVPRLTDAVMHKNLGIAVSAAEALALIKADEYPEWSRLRQVLAGHSSAAWVFHYLVAGPSRSGQPSDLALRRLGLICLSATGPAAVVAYGDVIELLKFSKEPELRACSVIALGAMVSKTNTVPLLKGVLQDQEEWPNVSAAAAQALAAAVPGDT